MTNEVLILADGEHAEKARDVVTQSGDIVTIAATAEEATEASNLLSPWLVIVYDGLPNDEAARFMESTFDLRRDKNIKVIRLTMPRDAGGVQPIWQNADLYLFHTYHSQELARFVALLRDEYLQNLRPQEKRLAPYLARRKE